MCKRCTYRGLLWYIASRSNEMLAFCPSFWSLNLQSSHLVSESMPQGGKEMMAGRLRDMLGRLNVPDQNYLGLISDFSQSGEFLSTYGKIIGEDSLSGTNCYTVNLPTAAFYMMEKILLHSPQEALPRDRRANCRNTLGNTAMTASRFTKVLR